MYSISVHYVLHLVPLSAICMSYRYHRHNSCVPTPYVTHSIYVLCPQHIPTVYKVCICCGYMPWTTFYAVEHMQWRTVSMLPTPYAYGVGNTYTVDNVLYTVGTYSVGDILWTSRLYTVGYICCGNIQWTTKYILWGTYAVDIYCGRHNIYCG